MGKRLYICTQEQNAGAEMFNVTLSVYIWAKLKIFIDNVCCSGRHPEIYMSYNLVRITLRARSHPPRHRMAASLSRDGSDPGWDLLRDYWLGSRPKQLPAESRITGRAV